jgi:NAD(P)-dependent dehydrogenase (short-subunit alcohol dehydrogenase family)
MPQRLSGKLALITGASRGIGEAVALAYAREGAQLILVARSVQDLERIDDQIRIEGGLPPLLIPLDLRNYLKIDEMAGHLATRYGKLDILVGNAGMLGELAPLHHTTPQNWHDVIGLNLNSNWHLLRALDPLLRQSDAGRVIMLTSDQTPEPYWGVYATSKAALEMMTQIYSNEVKSITNIKVNLMNPGGTDTAMLRKAFPGEDFTKYPKPDQITEAFVVLASTECTFQGEIINAQEFGKQGLRMKID